MEATLEICLLLAVSWPALRVFLHPPFLRAFPGPSLALAVAFGVYCVALAGLALHFPAGLRALSLLAAAAAVFFAWWGRPFSGRSRGLPPGSLVPFPIGPYLDDLFYLKRSRRHGPVFKSTQFGIGNRPSPCPGHARKQGIASFFGVLHPCVNIVGWDYALELLRRHERALETPGTPFVEHLAGGFVRTMGHDTHSLYRAVFQPVLANRDVVRSSAAEMVRCIDRGLARMADSAATSSPPGVRPEPYIERLLFGLFARLFFGCSTDDGEVRRRRSLFHVIRITGNESPAVVAGALAELSELLTSRAERILATSEDGASPPNSYLAALLRENPKCLEDPVIVHNFVYIMQAAHRDVVGLLVWIVKMLADHPRWLTRVAEDADARGSGCSSGRGDVADRIVMETLRLEQSELLYRFARAQIRFRSFVIPKGWLVRICVRESHRDADLFEDPDRFDPDRFLGRNESRPTYVPFGAFGRTCPGADVTGVIASTFVTRLAHGFDLEVVRDGPRQFGMWHWEPSSRLLVRLTRKAATQPPIAPAAT